MPEKTLKEKVKAGESAIKELRGRVLGGFLNAAGTAKMEPMFNDIQDALTALEARVEELEEENEKLKNPVPGYTTGQW